jgi:hypothetical protein
MSAIITTNLPNLSATLTAAGYVIGPPPWCSADTLATDRACAALLGCSHCGARCSLDFVAFHHPGRHRYCCVLTCVRCGGQREF